jgi:hypothetical protein
MTHVPARSERPGEAPGLFLRAEAARPDAGWTIRQAVRPARPEPADRRADWSLGPVRRRVLSDRGAVPRGAWNVAPVELVLPLGPGR